MDFSTVGTGIWAFVITAWKLIDSFMQKHKEIISAIVLRVQKDTADGTWTSEEKEQEVVDIFNQYVKPKLPWYVNLFISDEKIKKYIREACERASQVK